MMPGSSSTIEVRVHDLRLAARIGARAQEMGPRQMLRIAAGRVRWVEHPDWARIATKDRSASSIETLSSLSK